MKEWDRNLNLIRELVLKDLKIRYSRPVLGFLWAFLSPFLMVLIFYIIFGMVLKVKIEAVPFVLYLMTGVFPWLFFQDCIIKSATSLVDNKNLIRESNFPHYLIPISIIIANLINFLPSLLILILSSLIILKGMPIYIVLLPVILLVHLLMIAGLSIICSILYVRWRDTKYLIEALLLLLFYLTPVFYSISAVKSAFSPVLFKIYAHNPFVEMVNLYRAAFLKNFSIIAPSFSWFLTPLVFAVLVLMLSAYLYIKNKRILNDHLAY